MIYVVIFVTEALWITLGQNRKVDPYLYSSLIRTYFFLTHRLEKSCAGYCVYLSCTELPLVDAAADTTICKVRGHEQSPVAGVAVNILKSQADCICPVSDIICNLCAIAAMSRLVYGLCCTCAHCLTGWLYRVCPFLPWNRLGKIWMYTLEVVFSMQSA
jgi:hypothetical protein